MISNDIILSAAHCYKDNIRNSKLFVVLGSVEPLKQGSPLKEIERYNKRRRIKPIHEIKEIFLHKAYKVLNKEAYNDVAITRLKQKIKLNQYIHPLCLPLNPVVQNDNEETERSIQSQRVIVTGYITGMLIQFGEFSQLGALKKCFFRLSFI